MDLRCGISTACFFPGTTLDALQQVIDLGAPVTEIFLNTFSEVEEDYIAKLKQKVDESGIKVVSVHPFSSAMEGFFFATMYEGRMADGMAIYRKFFAACSILGADKLVFHGDHRANPLQFPLESYAHNFNMLAKAGREYGVTLCHENVYYCRLGDPAAVREIRPLLGENAAFVLDTKQAHRFGVSSHDMLEAMAPHVRHVHLSDYTPEKDCVAPGAGCMDTAAFLQAIKTQGYDDDIMIEVYRDGFDTPQDLGCAMRHINAQIAALA